MKILTILRHSELTGVGTWNYTLISAINDNSNITVWFKSKAKDSILINMFKSLDNVKVVFTKPKTSFDITFTNFYEPDIPKSKTVKHFIHNVMSNDYLNPNADLNICFSKRSFDFIKGSNKILIKQGIDLNKFPLRPGKVNPDKVLVFDSRNSSFLNSMVLSATSMTNMYVSYLGKNDNYNVPNRWNVEDYIENADLVIAVGRSAIEAMAMGKSVIIANHLNATGLVTLENLNEQAETSFSGWLDNKVDVVAKRDMGYFIKEFNKYNKKDALAVAKKIRNEYDIKKIIELIVL